MEGLKDDAMEVVGTIGIVPELGSDSPYVGSLDERMVLVSEGRYRERLNEYFRTGEQRGYRPLKTATEQMDAALSKSNAPTSGLTIAVTHDINVTAFLAGMA